MGIFAFVEFSRTNSHFPHNLFDRFDIHIETILILQIEKWK